MKKIEVSKKYGDRTHSVIVRDEKTKKSVALPIKSKLTKVQILEILQKHIEESK